MSESPGGRSSLLRRLASVPAAAWLLTVFAGFVALYVWQAVRRDAPTIFTDELEMTQISRAIAESGSPARRGVDYGFTTLVPWLTAPFWWLGSVASAFEAIKVFQALVMTAAVFPAYGIARFVVSRPWALAAAVLSVAVPALSYAPILKEEPFAYPAATVAVLLIMRAVAEPRLVSLAVALAASLVAAAVRGQLAVLAVVLGLSLAVRAWRSGRVTRWRSRWSRWEWVAAAIAAAAAAIAAYLLAARVSSEVDAATTELRGQMWEYGIWAAGAWAIGIGLAPAVAMLAGLFRPRAAYVSSRVLAFTVVAAFTIAAVVVYAAVKAAVISTILGPLVVERNVVYLTPIAMAALVSLLANRDSPWWAIVASGGVWTFLVSRTPLKLEVPYYESHGLAITAWASSELGWTASTLEDVLTAVGVGSVLVLGAVCALRRLPAVATGLAVVVLAATAAWGLTAEIHADRGERFFAATFAARSPQPRSWIDEAVDGRDVTVLGQEMGEDPTELWLTEFWNRTIAHMWSVDGSAPGPGPTLTPDLAAPDGTLSVRTDTDYALVLEGVDLAGDPVAELGTSRVVSLHDGILRLRSSQTGIGEGSWTGARAAFNRFDVDPHTETTAHVTLARTAFCAPVAIPSEAVVRIGPLTVGDDRQPALARVSAEQRVRVTPCSTVAVDLPAPASPWRLEIESETFVPNEIDPNLTDRRQLGVQASLEIHPG